MDGEETPDFLVCVEVLKCFDFPLDMFSFGLKHLDRIPKSLALDLHPCHLSHHLSQIDGLEPF